MSYVTYVRHKIIYENRANRLITLIHTQTTDVLKTELENDSYYESIALNCSNDSYYDSIALNCSNRHEHEIDLPK